jgi:thioredoxin 1
MSKKQILQVVVLTLVFIAIVGVFLLKKERVDSTKKNVSSEEVMVTDTLVPFLMTELNLENLLSMGLPVLLDFGADWCQPCRTQEPILRKLHSELDGKAIIQYIDTEKYPEIASMFPVRVIPTQVLFNSNGKPWDPQTREEAVVGISQYNYKDSGDLAFTIHEGVLLEEQMRQVLKNMGMK